MTPECYQVLYILHVADITAKRPVKYLSDRASSSCTDRRDQDRLPLQYGQRLNQVYSTVGCGEFE